MNVDIRKKAGRLMLSIVLGPGPYSFALNPHVFIGVAGGAWTIVGIQFPPRFELFGVQIFQVRALPSLSDWIWIWQLKTGRAERQVERLKRKRQRARARRNFAEADRLRERLQQIGVTVADNRIG